VFFEKGYNIPFPRLNRACQSSLGLIEDNKGFKINIHPGGIIVNVMLTLVGLDGNAFSLMGAFQRAACRQGWSKEEIDKVLDECKKSDYNHLLATLAENCDDENDDSD
jgi:hypothetical protein